MHRVRKDDDGSVIHDEERCYRALRSRDRRFDGWFFVAVTTTGIFCRPSCPATPAKRSNVRFLPTAAAAQQQGFRACRRCRPDTAPGSPEWDQRADLAGRAMRLVNDGVVDREGVGGLARRLAVGERHLHRVLRAQLGAGPLALARARRAQTARILIETTDLPFTQVAFASGYASIRQFNDSVREAYGANPTALRRDRTTSVRRGRSGALAPASPDGAAPSGDAARPERPTPLQLRLATRRPFDGPGILAHLRDRAVPGLEQPLPGAHRRVLALPHGPAIVTLRPADDHVTADLLVPDLRDLAPAVERCRRLLDLDADPEAVVAALGSDPLLGPLVSAVPGRRVPGSVDGVEALVRAVVGQQVSVAGARTLTGRILRSAGTPVPPLPDPAADDPAAHDPSTHDDAPPLSHAFPDAATLAGLDPTTLPLPRRRAETLVAAAAAVAEGRIGLDPGADRAETEARLVALPGIGRWTAAYLALRSLGDPDVFLPTDLAVRRALATAGGPTDERGIDALARRWRPWRSYALHHLLAGAHQPGARVA